MEIKNGEIKQVKEKNVLVKIYDNVCRFFSVRNLSWIAAAVFIFLLLPICYLSFVNRASGDDYGYGIYTRAAWVGTHSLATLAEAIWRTIRQYWYGWQGTWFSILVFSLQPEVFHDQAYVLVAFLMLFLWCGSTLLLFGQILLKELVIDRRSFCLISIIFLIINMQFIPSTKSSIFWFNGAAHYTLPFTMCQLLLVWLFKYRESYKARYAVGISFLMGLLGGSNYQAALFALIVTFYIGTADYLKKKNRRILILFLPVALELIGLIISMKAPGNKVRGGKNFGFSVSKGIETIILSFVAGLKNIAQYMKEKPLVFVGLVLLFIIMLEAIKIAEMKEEKNKKYSIVSGIALFCLYCAMQAPEIYAEVEVSSGVYNMNYQTFLLTTAGGLLIVARKLAVRIKLSQGEVHKRIVLPVIFLCLMGMLIFRSNLKSTTTWKCMEYIISGQAADYKKQMELQTRLLEDVNTDDVVLPFINDMQGPLMHMPVTGDKEAWTNTVTRDFYGKNSVIAIPRPEWEMQYADD